MGKRLEQAVYSDNQYQDLTYSTSNSTISFQRQLSSIYPKDQKYWHANMTVANKQQKSFSNVTVISLKRF